MSSTSRIRYRDCHTSPFPTHRLLSLLLVRIEARRGPPALRRRQRRVGRHEHVVAPTDVLRGPHERPQGIARAARRHWNVTRDRGTTCFRHTQTEERLRAPRYDGRQCIDVIPDGFARDSRRNEVAERNTRCELVCRHLAGENQPTAFDAARKRAANV